MVAGAHLRILLAAALAALAFIVAGTAKPPPAPVFEATAAGSVSVENSRDGQAILDVEDLKPGESSAGTLTLSNRSGARQALTLGTSGVTDTPGPAGALLSERLALRVDRLAGGSVQEVYSGSVGGVAGVDLGMVPPSGAHSYRFTVTLPEGGPAIDDRYAGGSVDIGWRWTARSMDEPPEETEKEPVAEEPPIAPKVETETKTEERPRPQAPRSIPPVETTPVPDRADWEGPAAAGDRPVRLWIGGPRDVRLSGIGAKASRARSSRARLAGGGAFSVFARCRPACDVEAKASVRVGRTWITLPARTVGTARSDGPAAALSFRFTPGELRKLRSAFARGRRARVRLVLRAAAPGHAPAQVTRTLKIRR